MNKYILSLSLIFLSCSNSNIQRCPEIKYNSYNKLTTLPNGELYTGRCIVYDNYHEDHVKNFDDIPAKIAMASDLTIHDTLIAGTAGLESALVNCRSVFFDYYIQSGTV